MIVSPTAFLWFSSVMVMGIAIGWLVWDGRNLIRLWPIRHENQDEFFGAIIGLCMVVIGSSGLILHHLSL